jgi:hypothetical protein
VDDDLVAVQRPPEAALQGEPATGLVVEARGVRLDGVAARLLAPEQGAVGVADQGPEVLPVVGIQRRPDRAGHEQLLTVADERPLQCLPGGVEDPELILLQAHPLPQQHELVAGHAEDVAGAEPVDEPLPDLLQQLVARGVPEDIVDRSEPVEVEEPDADHHVAGGRPGERPLQPGGELDLVRQPGERIPCGLLVQEPLEDDDAGLGPGERVEPLAPDRRRGPDSPRVRFRRSRGHFCQFLRRARFLP